MHNFTVKGITFATDNTSLFLSIKMAIFLLQLFPERHLRNLRIIVYISYGMKTLVNYTSNELKAKS